MTTKEKTTTPPKDNSTAPSYDDLVARIKVLEAENQDQAQEIQGLNDHISDQEAERKISYTIATASDGAKYQLRFRSILMKVGDVNKRVTPDMVKADPTLLDELIKIKTPRIQPFKPVSEEEKGGQN